MQQIILNYFKNTSLTLVLRQSVTHKGQNITAAKELATKKMEALF